MISHLRRPTGSPRAASSRRAGPSGLERSRGRSASLTVGLLAGLVGQVALLALLTGTVNLGVLGWLVGVSSALVTTTLLWRGLTRSAASALGPANRVTLARAVLVGGVAALIMDGFLRPPAIPTLVALAAVALLLDGVDGWVARRTGTSSAVGARFDMEVDAFLVLVLSAHVAAELGLWVLVIGAARYLFVIAGGLLPWLRAPLPARLWRKVVAVVQAVVLILIMADALPRLAAHAAVGLALALLTESFGRDVLWLRRQRQLATSRSDADAPPFPPPSKEDPTP